jgi:carbonic anhydrase
MGAELPFITGGGLKDRYNFVQLHFHWGRSFSGSEHRIDGEQCEIDEIAYGIYDSIHFILLYSYFRYPAELHMVHYNSKYGTFSEALSHEDGLAVFGIMIEV